MVPEYAVWHVAIPLAGKSAVAMVGEAWAGLLSSRISALFFPEILT